MGPLGLVDLNGQGGLNDQGEQENWQYSQQQMFDHIYVHGVQNRLLYPSIWLDAVVEFVLYHYMEFISIVSKGK